MYNNITIQPGAGYTVTYPASTIIPTQQLTWTSDQTTGLPIGYPMPTYNGPPPGWGLSPTVQPIVSPSTAPNGPHWNIPLQPYVPPQPIPFYEPPPGYGSPGSSGFDPFKTLPDDQFKKELLKAYEKLKSNGASNPSSVMGDAIDVLKAPPLAPFDPTMAELLKKLLATEWAGPAVEVKEAKKASPEPVQEPQDALELTGPFRRKLDLE